MNIKAILYILSVVMIGAGAFFSFTNSGKIKEQIEVFTETESTKKSVQKNIADTNDKLDDTKGALDKAKTEKTDAETDIENLISKFEAAGKTLAAHKTDIGESDKKLANLAEIEAKVKAMLPEGIQNWNQIPGKIAELQNKKKLLGDDLLNLTKRNDKLQQEVDDKTKRLGEDGDRLAKMRRKIALNAKVGAITAVNNRFGFVVVNLGENNSNITAESELLITRAGRLLGRLKPSSVEQAQSVCDLNIRTLRPGVRIQPGDRVLLAKTVGAN